MNSHRPPREASPIDERKLTGTEKDHIKEINEVLKSVKDTQPVQFRDASTLWGQVDRDRTGRVLLIEGARGVGKTSLLVTLLDRWRTEWEHEKRGVDTEASLGFVGMGRVVRYLPILDFDPIPRDMPLVGWLVESWRRLAEHCDGHSDTASSKCTSKDGPASDKCSDEELSPIQQWNQLFQAAVMGWSTVEQSNLIERIIDQREQLSAWHQLEMTWRRFINRLLPALERCGQLPEKALVVVPIDDVDLQVERVVELLLVLRLFNHPRVVYLLTADLEHLTDVLALSFLGKHRHVARQCKELEDLADEKTIYHSRSLAEALVHKVFPASMTWAVKRLLLSELLDWRGGRFQKLLNRLIFKTNGLNLASNHELGDWLRTTFKQTNDFSTMTFREVQRLSEEVNLDDETEVDETIMSRRALRVLDKILEGDSDTFGIRIVRNRKSHSIRNQMVGRVEAWCREEWAHWVLSEEQKVVAGTTIDFLLVDSKTGKRSKRANAEALAIMLRANSDLVHAPGLIWDIGPAFVWTHWIETPRTAIFTWPFVRFPSPAELLAWAENWQQMVVERMVDKQNPSDYLAFSWLTQQLEWNNATKASLEGLRSHASGRSIDKNQWNELFDSLKAARGNERGTSALFKEFVNEQLPVFAAPEYGLTRATQELILSHTDATADFLVRRRNEVITSALAWHWRDLPDNDLQPPEKEDTENFRKHVDRMYDDSPWLERVGAKGDDAPIGESTR